MACWTKWASGSLKEICCPGTHSTPPQSFPLFYSQFVQFYPLTTGLGSGQDPHYSSDTQPWSFCYYAIGGKDTGLSLGVAERLMTILPLWGENLPEGSPQRRTELREGEGKTECSGQCLGSESSHPWKQIPWILPSCETSDSFSYVCIPVWVGLLSLATQRSLTNTESCPNPRLRVFGRLDVGWGSEMVSALPQHLAPLPCRSCCSAFMKWLGPGLSCFQSCWFLLLGGVRFQTRAGRSGQLLKDLLSSEQSSCRNPIWRSQMMARETLL